MIDLHHLPRLLSDPANACAHLAAVRDRTLACCVGHKEFFHPLCYPINRTDLAARLRELRPALRAVGAADAAPESPFTQAGEAAVRQMLLGGEDSAVSAESLEVLLKVHHCWNDPLTWDRTRRCLGEFIDAVLAAVRPLPPVSPDRIADELATAPQQLAILNALQRCPDYRMGRRPLVELVYPAQEYRPAAEAFRQSLRRLQESLLSMGPDLGVDWDDHEVWLTGQ